MKSDISKKALGYNCTEVLLSMLVRSQETASIPTVSIYTQWNVHCSTAVQYNGYIN